MVPLSRVLTDQHSPDGLLLTCAGGGSGGQGARDRHHHGPHRNSSPSATRATPAAVRAAGKARSNTYSTQPSPATMSAMRNTTSAVPVSPTAMSASIDFL